MSTGVWNTESDLLEDLMELAGNASVDENYIVRGSGPPPVLREQEDEDELMWQFGVTNSNGAVTCEQPDLKGIQEMVRLVNHNFSDHNVQCEPQIVVSKLNPYSPEFIPNTGKGTVNSDKNDKVDKVEIQFEEEDSNLREKIKNASKAKNKLEKNVAVISLLKLHAARTNQDDKPPNLLTPDYFKKPLKENSETPPIEVPTTSNTDTTSSPNKEPTKLDLDNSDIAETEIKQSVDKVNDWLNPQKPIDEKAIVTKSLKPHLEPITFRRKTVRGNSSPNPSVSQVKVARNDFVPSDYARELAEMYTKRVEKREAVVQKSNLITFDNLEEKLRDRDEKIKASLKKQETESNPRP